VPCCALLCLAVPCRVGGPTQSIKLASHHHHLTPPLLSSPTTFLCQKLCSNAFQGGVGAVVADDKYRGELFGLGHNHTVYRGGKGQQGQQGGGGGGRHPQLERTGSMNTSMNLSQSRVSGAGVSSSGLGAAAGAGGGGGGGEGGADDES
jgi:hypothetical protein